MAPKNGALGPSGKGDLHQGHPKMGCPRCRTSCMQTPFLNPNPLTDGMGYENVARVRVNGESCMALLDNGMQINTITPGFIKNHSLDVGPLSDLVGR